MQQMERAKKRNTMTAAAAAAAAERDEFNCDSRREVKGKGGVAEEKEHFEKLAPAAYICRSAALRARRRDNRRPEIIIP